VMGGEEGGGRRKGSKVVFSKGQVHEAQTARTLELGVRASVCALPQHNNGWVHGPLLHSSLVL
jgi:hypothetical protein